MDTLIANINNPSSSVAINYNNIIIDLHKSKCEKRAKYINYVVHGINKDILNVDKLFFKSLIMCPSVKECFAVGLFLRLGADIERFYNGKHPIVHIVDKYSNYDKEVFVFLVVMLLLTGATYNDFAFKDASDKVSTYFMSKSLEMFFPKNVRLSNQKLLNIFMDKNLTETEYNYLPHDIVENLCINLTREMLVKRKLVVGEDSLVSTIIDSCNYNLFYVATESTYAVTYFSLERLCNLVVTSGSSDSVIFGQLKSMVEYLNSKKIYFDNYQYDKIRRIFSDIKYTDNQKLDNDVKGILSQRLLDDNNPMQILKKIGFVPDYAKKMSTEDLKNLMYKAVHYRIKECGVDKTLK